MKIECLKPGTDITIDASDGTKNLSFASSVLEVTENDREYLKQVCPRSFNLSQIPIAVVYEQEYVVNFESKTAVCSVTALIDGRPYIWDRVKIIIINLPDSGNCYMAFSTGNVKPYNRRSEYRLPLMGDAIIGMGGTTKDAIIRDISRSGIGLMCDEGFGLERGMHLEAQFKTKIGWSAQPTLFRLEGTVLRVIPAGKSRVNVGCRLTRADANLGKFIATKQREMLTTARNKKN